MAAPPQTSQVGNTHRRLASHSSSLLVAGSTLLLQQLARPTPYALPLSNQRLAKQAAMDVYISEEYVMKRRAERRAARDAAAAAAARGGRRDEKAATARPDGGELMKRWTAAWAETSSSKRPGAGDGINASAGAGGGVEDVVFSYFSA